MTVLHWMEKATSPHSLSRHGVRGKQEAARFCMQPPSYGPNLLSGHATKPTDGAPKGCTSGHITSSQGVLGLWHDGAKREDAPSRGRPG